MVLFFVRVVKLKVRLMVFPPPTLSAALFLLVVSLSGGSGFMNAEFSLNIMAPCVQKETLDEWF